MTDLAVWAPTVPPALAGLSDQVARILGATAASVDAPGDLAGDALALVLITASGADRLGDLDRVIAARTAPTVLVVGDGWIGTDGPDIASALAGAGAVALARSIAVRRTGTGRVNVVCVPEGLVVAEAGSQRGPLKLDIASADIAEVVAFLLSDESSYIDGQVLYADGGRQLFSSLTA